MLSAVVISKGIDSFFTKTATSLPVNIFPTIPATLSPSDPERETNYLADKHYLYVTGYPKVTLSMPTTNSDTWTTTEARNYA